MFQVSVLRVPLTIRPSFWLVALLIAPLPFEALVRVRAYPFYAAWIGVVLVSVVAHELGHALLARRFGAKVTMALYALGGYTTWETASPLGPWRRVAVAAAGSAVGFALGGGAWALAGSGILPDHNVLQFAVEVFWQVNLLWGVLNWLPIRPLDGGHIFLGILQGIFGRRGSTIADVVFPLFTVVAGLVAWWQGFVIAAFLAIFVLVEEMRVWTARRSASRPRPRVAEHDEAPFSLFGQDEQTSDPQDPERGAGGPSAP